MIRVITVVFVLLLGLVIYLADQNTLPDLLKLLWKVPYGDKMGHFVILGTLTLLVNLSLKNISWGPRILWGSTVIAVLITAEEFSQMLIPHRTFELLDLLANYTGILCGSALALYLGRGRQKHTTAAVQDGS